MKQHFTPRQVARAIGVSESSLKRWCDGGKLDTVKTAGGHRRIPVHSVLDFLRVQKFELVDPAAIGLPRACGQTERVVKKGKEFLLESLTNGNHEQTRQVIFDHFLAGNSFSEMFDGMIRPVLAEIGHQWETGELAIYEERRSVQVLLQTLQELRVALPKPEENAPSAVGASPGGDPYQLPTQMADLVCLEAGWRSSSLGANIPFSSLEQAIRDLRPDLFWLSISSTPDELQTIEGVNALHEVANECGSRLVIGGKAVTESVRTQTRYAACCDSMQNLADFLVAVSGIGLKARDIVDRS